jgi:hypothetical protein
MLLHNLGGVLTFYSQKDVTGIRTIRAAIALPIAPLELNLTYRRYELAFFGAFVFLFPSTCTGPKWSPFFSAASIRRATASLNN